LAEGVCALHQAGKLHRDLKPANALVRPGGQVVLLDFGLVTELLAVDHPSPHGAELGPDQPSSARRAVLERLTGTVPYMSPEQAAARPLSAASDWYSVGVMLFEAITGRLPFGGPAEQVLWEKQIRDPPTPSALIAGVPEDLDALCVALLRRDPRERPDGAEVLARLRGPGAARLPAALAPESFPFVGREEHLADLRRAFEEMLCGAAVVYHVHGPSARGRAHWCSSSSRSWQTTNGDALVLAGRCYEQESVPYKAVDSLMDALARFLARLERTEAAALMPADAADAAALTRVFPVLDLVEALADAARGAAQIGDLHELRGLAFAAVRQMLERIGSRWPLVLYVDDVQWGDVDSAALLSAVLRPPKAPRLLLVLAYRSEYAQASPCLRALATLAAHEDAVEQRAPRGMPVDALTPAEARRLALSIFDGGRGAEPAVVRARAEWIRARVRRERVPHLRVGPAREGGRIAVDGGEGGRR